MSALPGEIRVLRIINRFNLGGPTFNVAYLTKHLGSPFHTQLIGGAKDESEASSEFILDNLGIRAGIIPDMKRSISPVNDYKAYRHIRKIIREFRPHIVHTHASKAGTLGRLAAVHLDVPIVLHTFHGHVFHSYFGKASTTFYKNIERMLARKTDRIIAISEQQKHEIGTEHNICPPEKIEVIPLGFDLDRFQYDQETKRKTFRDKYGLQEDDVAVGIVGRLVPVKNHRMFLDAIKVLDPATMEKMRFFIIGDGESREDLLQYTRDLQLPYTWMEAPSKTRPLCFTSWIKEVDLVMAGLDIVCLTSLNEGTPVSLIEAQSASKPVVSTKVGGIGDIVSRDSALLCQAGETAQYAEHLRTLAGSRVLREEMGKAGNLHVIEKYGYQRLVSDIEKLYRQLLSQKSITV